MHIRIPKRVLERMTEQELALVDRAPNNITSLDILEVDLLRYDDDRIDNLRACFDRLKGEGSRQVGVLINDIKRWTGVMREGGAGQARPRSLRQFADLVAQYIRTSPGYRIYQQVEGANVWIAHYVNHIQYHAELRDRNGSYNPASVSIHVLSYELGSLADDVLFFNSGNVDGRTVAEALGGMSLMVETDAFRDDYLKTKVRYDGIFDQVGRQFLASGFGVSMRDRYSRRRNSCTTMMHEGIPAKVVMDVVQESGENVGGSGKVGVRANFWASKKRSSIQTEEGDWLPSNMAIVDGMASSDLEEDAGDPEIPIHPYVPIYHLGRHTRYKVHVDDLEDYRFNHELGDSLVLPQSTKNLVNILVGQGKISFQDIIEGKGSGACVLLLGPPGVGKTLTAEVFAEATERPLLSVQAAQLGTAPDRIEQALTRVLERANRWNAVVLLDEADVYIAERGTNLDQNAIVAAFLRILERHSSTLFMTTNRTDSVDDAIASRCIARIEYDAPTLDEQKAIWHILNNLNDAGLDADAIEIITAAHSDLTGRDIKQLLKLASLWSSNRGVAIDPESIAFVKQFLSTRPSKGPAGQVTG